MKLTLERTRITTLWINGRRVGSCDSLCTPHVYEISAYVAKPLVEIVVCVENTGYPTKGGHLTSPDTQSNWNGITGSMTLEVFSEVLCGSCAGVSRSGAAGGHSDHAAPRGKDRFVCGRGQRYGGR
ncbi:MAG: hypothetical protein ACLUSL_10050 [Ruminococcus sp.]